MIGGQNMEKKTYEAPRSEVFRIEMEQMLDVSQESLRVTSSDLEMEEKEVKTGGDMWHWSR